MKEKIKKKNRVKDEREEREKKRKEEKNRTPIDEKRERGRDALIFSKDRTMFISKFSFNPT